MMIIQKLKFDTFFTPVPFFSIHTKKIIENNETRYKKLLNSLLSSEKI